MELAFVGLGVMGSGMARNLVELGFKVRVFDVSEKALAPFRELDCRIAGSAREAADGAEAVSAFCPMCRTSRQR